MCSNYFSETLYSPKNLCSFPPNNFPQSGQVPCSIGTLHYSKTNEIYVSEHNESRWLCVKYIRFFPYSGKR